MVKQPSTYQFERIAFESALLEHPGDRTAALAYQDWLEENGHTNMGARRIVTRTVRQAIENAQAVRVRQMLGSPHTLLTRVRAIITRRFVGQLETIPQIHVVCGGAAPTKTRVPGVWRDVDGQLYASDSPSLPSRDRIRWVPTVETITVGAAWVLNILEPPSTTRQRS